MSSSRFVMDRNRGHDTLSRWAASRTDVSAKQRMGAEWPPAELASVAELPGPPARSLGLDPGREAWPDQAPGEPEPFLYSSTGEMARLIDRACKAATHDRPVLLAGETGTGKTCLARIIHFRSPRWKRPFVVVNCAARPGTLLESELFGHVRGAFRGADRDHAGKLAVAQGGTLLLEDVHALPLTTQVELLRALKGQVFRPLGSDQALPVQARVIVATSVDLEAEVAAGRFSPALYRVLKPIRLMLPPLRDRREMLAPIARSFAFRFGVPGLQEANRIAARVLLGREEYPWPGNIRELRNLIEREVIFDGVCGMD